MPGLRSFLFAFCLGQVFLLWWMSGQYDPPTTQGAEPTAVAKVADGRGPLLVWSAADPVGRTWGKDGMIGLGGDGHDGGTAITLTFEGDGWKGCGLNWKGWFPEDSGDDVSKYRSLTFYVRQVTDRPDADLTVHLMDSNKRPQKLPVSNPMAVVGNGALTRIDSTWRKVVLPLDKFAANKDLNLRKLWGIDFSSNAAQRLVFQIDQIAFTLDTPRPPGAKFPAGESFTALARVKFDEPTYPIHDEIFGVCDLPADKLCRYGIPVTRWGGNRSTRHNWKVNADNAGKDWFFKNGGAKIADLAQTGYVKFAKNNQQAGATGYLTIPMIGYVSKDHDSSAYSVRKYGKQQAAEAGHADVGNGVHAERGTITWNDPEDTSVAVGPEFIAEAVRFVSQQAGKADSRGVRYWVLDNEPMLWHLTHRDVRKKAVGYDELWDLTVKYAEAIKREDPSAKVAGFCSWGWMDLFYSAADEGGDQYQTHRDYNAHGRVPLGEWFVMKCAEYRKTHGKPLIDVFDLHWYPQARHEGRDPYEGHGGDLKFNQLRMRTTRDLWDPAYTPESWTKEAAGGGPAMVVRRAKEWIAKHDPAMELAVGEYNFGGSDNITGGLAQADVLGILAREKVDLAFIWNTPEGTQELAWKLFRDYDDRGGRFGDRFVPADSNTPDVTVYAAKRSRDGATTVVVVNKSLTGEAKTAIDLPGLKGRMRVWRFDQETEGKVQECPKDAKAVNGAVTLTLPAASATMIVIE